VVGLSDRKLLRGEKAPIHFLSWKSGKLPTVTTATLNAEGQAQLRALSKAEWLVHRLAEALFGPRETNPVLDVKSGEMNLDGWMTPAVPLIPVVAFTDCKSLYDHIKSRSSPTAGLTDSRTGLVLTSVRESIKRLHAEFRWVPSALMIADALTKVCDGDYLRHLMSGGEYQIQSEEIALMDRARARKERLERGERRAREAEASKRAKPRAGKLQSIQEDEEDEYENIETDGKYEEN
jgi:hypothetical protein